MKKFIGYHIIGAGSIEEARAEKGLLLWSKVKPSGLKRLFNRVLLGIYWVDKERHFEERGKTGQSGNSDVEMPRLKKAKDAKPYAKSSN